MRFKLATFCYVSPYDLNTCESLLHAFSRMWRPIMPRVIQRTGPQTLNLMLESGIVETVMTDGGDGRTRIDGSIYMRYDVALPMVIFFVALGVFGFMIAPGWQGILFLFILPTLLVWVVKHALDVSEHLMNVLRVVLKAS